MNVLLKNDFFKLLNNYYKENKKYLKKSFQ